MLLVQLLVLLAAAISQLGQLVIPLGQLLVLCPPPGELVSKDGGQAHGGGEKELQISC